MIRTFQELNQKIQNSSSATKNHFKKKDDKFRVGIFR